LLQGTGKGRTVEENKGHQVVAGSDYFDGWKPGLNWRKGVGYYCRTATAKADAEHHPNQSA